MLISIFTFIYSSQMNTTKNLFQYFGDITINTNKNLVILTNIDKLQAEKYIIDTIDNILCNVENDINILLLNNYLKLFTSLSDDIYHILDIIYNKITSIMKAHSDTFQEDIKNNTFTIDKFTIFHKQYFSKKRKLSYVFKTITELINIKDVFNIILNYILYEQIYNLNMFSVLLDSIKSLDDIVNVFTIFNRYNGFSYSTKNKFSRKKIFNESLDKIINTKFINDDNIKLFMIRIDANIKLLYQKKYTDLLIDDTIMYIKMCQKNGNAKTFISLYYQYMQERTIIDPVINNRCELSLLKLLN